MPPSSPPSDYASLLASRGSALKASLQPSLSQQRDLTCEFGSGHGHFLTAYAHSHPGEFCVGVDILEDRITRAQRKRDRAELPNLHFLRAEATLFLNTLPAEVLIRRAFVLFPDPWPKTRHHKHRLIQTAFLTLLRSHAMAGAELFFRSDHAPAFENARALVSSHASWRISDRPWPFEFETVFQQRAPHYFSFCAEALP